MMFTLYYLVPLLIVFKVLDNSRIRNVDLRYQYKFYELRDELRQLIINNKLDKFNPSYVYLDNAISTASSSFVRLNFYLILYFLIFKKRDAIETNNSIIVQERKFKNSRELIDINKKYKSLFYEYLKEKSMAFIIFLAIIYFVIKKISLLFSVSSWNRYLIGVTQKFKQKVILSGNVVSYNLGY